MVLYVQLLRLTLLVMRPATAAAAADRCRTPALTAPRRGRWRPGCAGARRQRAPSTAGHHGQAREARRSSVPTWDHPQATAHRPSTPDVRHALTTCRQTHRVSGAPVGAGVPGCRGTRGCSLQAEVSGDKNEVYATISLFIP